MRLSARRSRIAALPFLALAAITAACSGVIDTPELYVLAATPTSQGRSPETRVSFDGRRWSGPNYPRDAQGSPIAARGGVPAGVGTNFDKYLLAFFDGSGTLRTQESEDGLAWSSDRTHGSFTVGQHSRPAVAFDFKTARWYVAFRQDDSRVVVRGFSASGQGTTATVIPDVTTGRAIGFAITDAGVPAGATHSRLLVAYRDGAGEIRLKETLDPDNWPAGAGAEVGLFSESGPFLEASFGLVRLGLTGSAAPPLPEDPSWNYFPLLPRNRWGENPGRLAHGSVSVIQATDASLASWQRVLLIDGGTTAAGFSPAFAGPATATVAAKGNYPLATTSTWFSNGNVGRIAGNPPRAEIGTDTGLDVAMTFGQAGGGSAAVRNVILVFRRFHRGVPERGETEDVTLEVEHYGLPRIPGDDSTRPLLGRMSPWEVEDARQDATVSWVRDSSSQLPRFGALIQPGEHFLVKVTGEDGTVSGVLTFDAVVAAGRAQGDSELRADDPSNRVGYSVFFLAQPQ